MVERTASPRELAEELGEPLSDVSYHVKVLHELGLIEAAGTKPVRGALQHFYRSVERPLLSEEEFAQLSLDERLTYARHICQVTFADISSALEKKTFSARPEHAICRVPMQVDEAGFRELGKIYEELVDRVLDVQAKSAERIAHSPESESIPTTALAIFFETPSPGPRD